MLIVTNVSKKPIEQGCQNPFKSYAVFSNDLATLKFLQATSGHSTSPRSSSWPDE